MAEYTAKFNEFDRFVPSVVPTEDARGMKYIHGLNIDTVKHDDRIRSSILRQRGSALRIDGWDEKLEKSHTVKTYTQTDNQAVVPFQGNKRHFQ